MPDTEDTKTLLAQVESGDAAAVDRLLERHLPGLRAFVRLRSGPVLRARESSGDLVQSVCREILKNRGRLRHDGESGFKRWLYRTALRKIVNRHEYYQAAKRDVRREAPAAGSDEVLAGYGSLCTPSQEASANEQVACIEAAFDRLPEHYREVIVGSRLLGLSHAELAAQCGKSESAIRTTLSRALAQLAYEIDRA